jgi:hypothetical protein
VTTYTSDLQYQIDQKISNVFAMPDLEEGQLSGTSFSKTPGLVGVATDFTFMLTTLNVIPAQGYLTIAFEDDSFQVPEPIDDLLCLSEDGADIFSCSFDTHPSSLISSITV